MECSSSTEAFPQKGPEGRHTAVFMCDIGIAVFGKGVVGFGIAAVGMYSDLYPFYTAI